MTEYAPKLALRQQVIAESAPAYFDALARTLRRIDLLRRIELSFLVVILSYAIAQDAAPFCALLSGGVIFLFALVELRWRGQINAQNTQARQALTRADTDAPGTLSFAGRLALALQTALLPSFLIWNLPLLALAAVLALF